MKQGRRQVKARARSAWLVLATALAASGNSAADSVAVSPSKDNTIFSETSPTGHDLSNGAGPYFFAGANHFIPPNIRRGLIAFNIAGSVPTGSTIQSASLTLHMSKTTSPAVVVDLHRSLSNWGEGTSVGGGPGGGQGAPATEGDATWRHTFYPDRFWVNPSGGGDYAATASATALIGGLGGEGFYTWDSTAMLVSDVQSWLDSPGTNFGWVLLSQVESAMSTKRFDTRENSDPSFRPVLRVDFVAPGTDAGTTDAGTDAGTADAGMDAGTMDAGMDAGTTDAGMDAGTTDAGPSDARIIERGWGCQSGSGLVFALATLTMLGTVSAQLMRRRGVRVSIGSVTSTPAELVTRF